jgi:hypothetical protein
MANYSLTSTKQILDMIIVNWKFLYVRQIVNSVISAIQYFEETTNMYYLMMASRAETCSSVAIFHYTPYAYEVDEWF